MNVVIYILHIVGIHEDEKRRRIDGQRNLRGKAKETSKNIESLKYKILLSKLTQDCTRLIHHLTILHTMQNTSAHNPPDSGRGDSVQESLPFPLRARAARSDAVPASSAARCLEL